MIGGHGTPRGVSCLLLLLPSRNVADFVGSPLGKPESAIRPSSDTIQTAIAAIGSWKWEDSNSAGTGDAPDLVLRITDKPEITVRSGDNS